MDQSSTVGAPPAPTTKAKKRSVANEDVQHSKNRGSNGTTPAPKRAKTITEAHDSNQTIGQKPVQKGQVHRKQVLVSHHNVLSGTDDDAPRLARSWLKRPQNLSDQLLFLIFCRDNLVPGSRGMKPWDQVAAEFNERFKDELKQPLAWNTLSKRAGPAKKQFMAENPEYAAALKYPVPEYAQDDDDGRHASDPEITVLEHDDGEDKCPINLHGIAAAESARPPQRSTQVDPEVRSIGDTSHTNTAGQTMYRNLEPCYPTLISDHNISALDRARYHLRRRTKNPATFCFLDENEAELDDEDPQYLDHDILLNVSPFYRRISSSDPDAVLNIPKNFSIKTVNMFIQVVSPDRANALPTHYLWRNNHQVPGVYDRFGAITPEKIYWSVDVLLELQAFARYMEVSWISDMVIDRLHWMFTEQRKIKDACKQLALRHERKDAYAHKVYVMQRLSTTKDAHFWGLAADDFDEEYLAQLAVDPKAEKALAFIANLMHSLGSAPDASWLATTPKHAQYIFAEANDIDAFTSASREEFCARYHDHDDMSSCYSDAPKPSSKDVIDSLYEFSSQDELLTYSSQLMPTTTLAHLVHSASGGSNRTFKAANSSSAMLKAEKKIWEMEIQLEEAKVALWTSPNADLA